MLGSSFARLLLGGEKPWKRGWNLLRSCNVSSSVKGAHFHFKAVSHFKRVQFLNSVKVELVI